MRPVIVKLHLAVDSKERAAHLIALVQGMTDCTPTQVRSLGVDRKLLDMLSGHVTVASAKYSERQEKEKEDGRTEQ